MTLYERIAEAARASYTSMVDLLDLPLLTFFDFYTALCTVVKRQNEQAAGK